MALEEEELQKVAVDLLLLFTLFLGSPVAP